VSLFIRVSFRTKAQTCLPPRKRGIRAEIVAKNLVIPDAGPDLIRAEIRDPA
jgi:hypothetical protein